MSTHMNYNRVGRRYHGSRGFRLNSKRFSVQRLRGKLFSVLRIFSRWRSAYGQAIGSLKRSLCRSGSKKDGSGSSRRKLVANNNNNNNVRFVEYRLRSFGRSNSFYSEAIADCLEFIRKSSVSVEEQASRPMIG